MVRTIERKQKLPGAAPEECTTLAAYLLRDAESGATRSQCGRKILASGTSIPGHNAMR